MKERIWCSSLQPDRGAVDAMNGDSLPVSAFMDYVDGTFPQGAAPMKREGWP